MDCYLLAPACVKAFLGNNILDKSRNGQVDGGNVDAWKLQEWVSSWEVHRSIGVSQRTAWFMLQRIRKAMQTGSIVKIGGPDSEVEVDETFIGGKARNMHRARRARMRDASHFGKTIVQGLLVRLTVLAHYQPVVLA